MSIQIIPLVECPFCPDGAGGVFLDARKLMSYRLRGGIGKDMHAGVGQNILLYNSDEPTVDCCPHVLYLLLDLTWQSSCRGGFPCSNWSANIDWTHPFIKSGLGESDPLRSALDDILLGHVIPGAERDERKGSLTNRFVPRTECSTERFHLNWDEYIDGDLTGDYHVQGRICFSGDVRRLNCEMRTAAERSHNQENKSVGEVDERQTAPLSNS